MSANASTPTELLPCVPPGTFLGLCGPSELIGKPRCQQTYMPDHMAIGSDSELSRCTSNAELAIRLSRLLLPESVAIVHALRSKGVWMISLQHKVLSFLPGTTSCSANIDLFLLNWGVFVENGKDSAHDKLEVMLEAAWTEHPECCMKLIFHMGSKLLQRTRHVFYRALMWLWKDHPASLLANLSRVPQYGTWTDLCEILVRACEGQELSLDREKAMARKRHFGTKKIVNSIGAPAFKNPDRLRSAWRALQRYDQDPLYRNLFERVAALFAHQLREDLDDSTGAPSQCALACPSLDKSYDRRTLICEGIARQLFPISSHSRERNDSYIIRERFRKEILKPLRGPSRKCEQSYSDVRLPSSLPQSNGCLDITHWRIPRIDRFGFLPTAIVEATFVASMLRKAFGIGGLSRTLVAQNGCSDLVLSVDPELVRDRHLKRKHKRYFADFATLTCASVASAFTMLAAECAGPMHRQSLIYDSEQNIWKMKRLRGRIVSNHHSARAFMPKEGPHDQASCLKHVLAMSLEKLRGNPVSVQRILFINCRRYLLKNDELERMIQDARLLFIAAKQKFPEVILWSLVDLEGDAPAWSHTAGVVKLTGFSSNILTMLMMRVALTSMLDLPIAMAKSLASFDVRPVQDVSQREVASFMGVTAKHDKSEPMVVDLHAKDILFTQASVSPRCRDGTAIRELVHHMVKDLELRLFDISHIRVCIHKGQYYSLDNRRLAAHRLVDMHYPNISRPIKCILTIPTEKEWEQKFSTRTLGRTVEVLQGHMHYGIVGVIREETSFLLHWPHRSNLAANLGQHVSEIIASNWLAPEQITPETPRQDAIEDITAEELDAPAQIPSDEAAAIQHELWASFVQGYATWKPGDASDASCGCRQMMLLEFSRHPKELEEALLKSSVAESARARDIEIKPDWARGAKVFVDGGEPRDLPPGVPELGPMHVVIYTDDEQDLIDELDHLPYNMRKIKPAVGRRVYPEYLSLMDVSSQSSDVVIDEDGSLPIDEDEDSNDFVIEYSVLNTFIHFAGRNDTRSVRTI